MTLGAYIENPSICLLKDEANSRDGVVSGLLTGAHSHDASAAVLTTTTTPTYSLIREYNMKELHFIEGLEFYNSTHLLLSDGYWGSSKIAYLQVSYPPAGSNAKGNISMT